MDLFISQNSDKPIYEQLFEQISIGILNGGISPAETLPTIRGAAQELGISVITVKKAWEALEHQGYIYSVVGRGCFVKSLTEEELQTKRRTIAAAKMEDAVKYCKSLGLSPQEMMEAMKKASG